MTLAELLVKIGLDPSGWDKGLQSAEKSFTTWGSRLSSVGVGMSALISAPILGIGGAATKMAMDAVESENLFKESFKGMADQARAWSVETAQALGINQYELRKTSSTFYVMFDAMSVGKDASYEMATGLSQLAYDFASFYNLKPEEAFTKLKAGIMGETEPLKALGILVDENTVKHAAYKNGIAEQGAELTQQQKVMARYAAIMAQTSTAQGDLARTADSPTNQLRRMKEQVTEAGISFGMALLPVIQKAISFLSGLVPYVQSAVQWFTSLSEPVKTGAVAFAGVLAVIGPIVAAFGMFLGAVAPIVGALGGMSAILGAVGSVFAVLTGPVGLVVAAVGALGYAVYSMTGSWQPFITIGQAAWNLLGMLGTLAMNIGGGALSMLGNAVSWTVEKVAWLGDAVSDVIKKFTGWMPSLDGVTSKIKSAGTWAWTYVEKLAGVKKETQQVASSTTAAAAPVAQLGNQYRASGDLAAFLAGESGKLGTSTEDAGKKAAKARDEWKKFVDDLKGLDAYAEAQKTTKGITEIGGAIKLTAAEQKTALGVLQAAIDKYQVMGQTAPRAVMNLITQLDGLVQKLEDGKEASNILFANLKKDIELVKPPLQNLAGNMMQFMQVLAPAGGKAGKANIFTNIAGSLKELAPQILQAVQGGGNIGKTIGASIGGAVGEGVGKAVGEGVGKAVGSTIGGIAGSIVPVFGTMIGAAVGGWIGGMFGKGGREKKEAEELRAKFLEAAGGAEQLRESAERAGISINEKMLNSNKPKEVQREIDRLSKSINAHESAVKGMATAIDGMNMRSEGFALNVSRSIEEQSKVIQARYDKEIAAMTAAGATSELIEAKKKQQAEELANTTFKATEAQIADYNRLGMFAIGQFRNMVAETGSVVQALASIEPTINTLTTAQKSLGLESTESVSALMSIQQTVSANQDVFMSLEGINMMLEGLGKQGVLRREELMALGTDASGQFALLTARGVEADRALALMQPTLQSLWEASQKHKGATDEQTASLLTLAQQHGLVGAQMQSTEQKMLDILVAIGDALGAKIPASMQAAESATERSTARMTAGFDAAGGAVNRFASGAVPALENVRAQVDGISFGSSPGGLKEYPPMLDAAGKAMGGFAKEWIGRLGDVRKGVDSVGLEAGPTLKEFVTNQDGVFESTTAAAGALETQALSVSELDAKLKVLGGEGLSSLAEMKGQVDASATSFKTQGGEADAALGAIGRGFSSAAREADNFARRATGALRSVINEANNFRLPEVPSGGDMAGELVLRAPSAADLPMVSTALSMESASVADETRAMRESIERLERNMSTLLGTRLPLALRDAVQQRV